MDLKLCVDDVKQVLDAVMYNLSFSGNDRVYDATRYYVDGRFVAGEETEVLYGYNQMLAIVNDVIRNNTVAKVSGTLNTFTLRLLLDLLQPVWIKLHL